MAKEKITIEGEIARLDKPNGKTVEMPLSQLFELAKPRRFDSCDMRLVQGARFIYTRGPLLLLVCEYEPGPYTLKWIEQDSTVRYGSGATYRKVTLSLPYVIVLAGFQGTRLWGHNECFFRNAPLTHLDEKNELFFPALLNCSRFLPPEGHPLSWICTQKLDRTPIRREKDPAAWMCAGMRALKQCLFSTGFNYSSEENEYSSWYTESLGIDERIETADRWHQETEKDRYFALDVPWLPTGMSLRAVVDRIYENQGIKDDGVQDATQLARLLINHQKKA